MKLQIMPTISFISHSFFLKLGAYTHQLLSFGITVNSKNKFELNSNQPNDYPTYIETHLMQTSS